MFDGVDLNELGGHRAAASGHLALAALLRDEHVDGIGAFGALLQPSVYTVV